MIRVRLLIFAVLLLPISSPAAPAAANGLRIPLGFDVFYEFEGSTGGGVNATVGSIVDTRVIPARDGRETLYIKAVRLGKTTLKSKGSDGPTIEVKVVPANENEYAEFVTRELGAGRILEPLPLIVGDGPSVVHEDEVGTIVVSDEMRILVKKKKLGKGRIAVMAKAVAPGWATLTIFDKKAQVARRYAFHLRSKTVAVKEPKSVAVAKKGPASAPVPTEPEPPLIEEPPTPVPPTATPLPEPTRVISAPAAPDLVDPPAMAVYVVPVDIGVIVPFASSIPAIQAQPKGAVEFRRLLLPAGRQGLHIIPRALGSSSVRVSDGKGATRHEFRIRGVAPEGLALGQRCEEEKNIGTPCEAVRVSIGELKIVEISVPIGTVVSSDDNILRYARRRASVGSSGSGNPRELSLQAIRSGVTDLNLFDEQGVLRRRMLIKVEGGADGTPAGFPPPPVLDNPLPIPK